MHIQFFPSISQYNLEYIARNKKSSGNSLGSHITGSMNKLFFKNKKEKR